MGFRAISGWVLLTIGALGILLPIIPGIPLIAAGVAMLGTDHRLVRAARDWLRRKGVLR